MKKIIGVILMGIMIQISDGVWINTDQISRIEKCDDVWILPDGTEHRE